MANIGWWDKWWFLFSSLSSIVSIFPILHEFYNQENYFLRIEKESLFAKLT